MASKPLKQQDTAAQLDIVEDTVLRGSVPAPASSTALATINDELAAMETGLENVGAKDLIVPRLTILQALSPQLQKSKPEYVAGAEAGDFCDTATGDVFRGAMKIVPCYYAMIYLEWAPRASGKGLVHNHGMDASVLDQCKSDERNRSVLPNGNYIATTATYYVLNLNAGGRRSFIPLGSTQLKAARRWMTLITNQRLKTSSGKEFVPPIFWRSWMATTVHQSNNDGDWFGWKFEPAEDIITIDPLRNLMNEARDFREQAKRGIVTGDVSHAEDEVVSGDESTKAF